MSRSLAVALAVAGCGGLALAACGGKQSPEAVATTNPVPVVVVAARQGNLREVVRAGGLVVAAPGAELAVVAPQPARIAELPHAEGERVHRGDLLVRFDVPSLQADVAARGADVTRARARLTSAHASRARVQGLFERGIAAKKEVEDAGKELADAQADVASATSAVAAATSLAGRAVVRAPFDGVVSQRLHNPGDLVDAAAADPVLRLIDPSRLQVQAAVPLTQLAGIALGQPARVFGPGATTPANGEVVGRPAAADPATGAANVRVRLLGSPSIPVNAPAQVEILTVEHAGVVIVPAAAVVQEGPRAFVYAVGADKHANRREVTLGISAAGEVEIRRGVAAGERVIVEGQTALPDGALVAVSRQATAP